VRPIIKLNEERFPTLENETFRICWVLSPDYTENFRPVMGEEVSTEKIRGWNILKLIWE